MVIASAMKSSGALVTLKTEQVVCGHPVHPILYLQYFNK